MNVRVAIAIAVVLAACQASPAPGAYCTRASDCPAPLACALGRCRSACRTSSDCPRGARCLVEPSSGMAACSLEQVDECATHDCPLHFVCRNGACLNVCGDVPACPDGRCDANACTPATGADAGPIADGGVDAGGVTTWTIPIASDLDDGELGALGAAVLFDGEGQDADFAGYWGGGPTWAFLRFALPDALPSGAHVLDARLHLTGVATGGLISGGDALAIHGDAAADAMAIATSSDFPGAEGTRTATGATVTWPSIDGWALGPNVSPDVSPILAELVTQHAGLARGAHVLFWLDAANYAQSAEVGFADTTPTSPGATLTITWSP